MEHVPSRFVWALALVLSAAGLGPPCAAQPPAGPLVIGHAGSGFFHPFNSLPPSSLRGIERALRLGADGVEVDLRLSQDSVPVLYHDYTLNSMTNGRGCVSQTPAAALVQLRYRGGWLHDWRQHERIIPFDTLLARLARRPEFPYLHLDLHEDDACAANDTARSRALARRLRELLTHYQVPAHRLLILTNRPATLRYLHQLLPAVPLGLELSTDFEADLLQLRQLPWVQAAVVHKDDITPARAARLHSLGQQVVVFGGRSARAERRVVATAPEAYQADNVRRLRAMLRRGNIPTESRLRKRPLLALGRERSD
ncbi:glycerophosphoryl diester phosphodiesterase [Hymenobacter daecheongensis DSM 21074]|uniref:Glycerophosphoryl diester phosphodiesterase n=1 Tax=Hymenobacter daecheongensis DSM 21074 TaxID=1121955 RepID=A0A1M6HKU6_9BACT|nr:glycerophosphodiester phosphodiesterase family protein [Hymenobacter daecheongensis]SHJ22797.1 glycerophosphoryl diester phosphodiesterase [Hymenobacter daecheongensis DSM 21074]